MATVRLVESGSDFGYGYLTIARHSQTEIESIVSNIVHGLNDECIDEDGVPNWCIEDITAELTNRGYEWNIDEEHEVNV